MDIPFMKTSIIAGRRVNISTLVKKALWFAIVIISVVYSVAASRDILPGMEGNFHRWLYVYLNFGSFVLGLIVGAIIFFRKPKSWHALAVSLMLVTFTATGNGMEFWRQLLTSTGIAGENSAYLIALFMNVLYLALFTSSLTYVLLAFPGEELPSRGARWFFYLLVASQVISILGLAGLFLLIFRGFVEIDWAWLVYNALDILKSLLLIGLAAWQIMRLPKIADPVQRQQVRWIAASLVGMTFFYALGILVTKAGDLIPVWTFLPLMIFTYGFIITLFIAIRRYRIWDMNVIINRALVYTAVTMVLTVIGFGGAALLDFIAKSVLESPNTWLDAFILLLVAGFFHPVRERMQALVDHYLKPEEVDFSSALVEFSPDAQLMLSSQQMLGIITRQAVEQLNLSGAAIYLHQEDGRLVHGETTVLDQPLPSLLLDHRTLSRLKNGNVVEALDASGFSLYIPLMVTRAAHHQFLGVLAFGCRNSGEGYSTPVLKSLKKLGCEAGKSIYIAQFREHLGRNIVDRLAAIERGLSTLEKTAST